MLHNSNMANEKPNKNLEGEIDIFFSVKGRPSGEVAVFAAEMKARIADIADPEERKKATHYLGKKLLTDFS